LAYSVFLDGGFGGRVDLEQPRSISGRFVALGNHPSDLGDLHQKRHGCATISKSNGNTSKKVLGTPEDRAEINFSGSGNPSKFVQDQSHDRGKKWARLRISSV
jgi:hypothetical protein